MPSGFWQCWALIARSPERQRVEPERWYSYRDAGADALCWFARVLRQCFHADTGKIRLDIREYFIPDFSNWKDQDSYQKAFERLLKNLQAAPVKS